MREYKQDQHDNADYHEYKHQRSERHGHGNHEHGRSEGRGHGGRRDTDGNNKDEHDGSKKRDGRNHSGRGQGHHGGRQGDGYFALAEPEGTHLLFIGSRSCFRHKGTQKLQLLQEGRLSFLCLDEIDWITGSYLNLIEQAAEELIQDLSPKHLVLFGGCQIELLSTDYEAITKNLSEQYSIDVHFHRGCHLIGYGEALEEKSKENERQGGSGR